MNIIPLETNVANFTQTIMIDGRTWRFDFRWNGRGGFWAFDLYNDVDVLVVAGIRMVALTEILRQYVALDVPQGALYFVNVTGPGGVYAEAEYDTLQMFSLTYVTEEEWDSGFRFDEIMVAA